MNATNHFTVEETVVLSGEDLLSTPSYLSLEDYDCIGFDLDHTLCRYNIGPMVRLEYDLLATFLVDKHGYDPAVKHKTFDQDCDFVCKGLTLDIDKGNILRLGKDGYILTATHGTRRMTDIEIEKNYGRCRKKHMASDYATHLQTHGPLGMNDFKLVVHSFMDYFDYATMLLCARIVDVLDQINNQGRPLDEYYFWPDVLEGLKEMFTRTHFIDDYGGYFPEIKANPEKYILKRSTAFRDWLKMLRANGKFLYVITGSNVDFASWVASYAVGNDWKDLFDIVVFFARKPSFFIDRRPFYKLNGEKEVDSFIGSDELDTGHYYSQGNWHDLQEFMEYTTEWEPSASLYFGDNILQDVLAPNKFTKTCDSVAVSEEMLAEGMVGHPASHPHAKDLISPLWGSYFYYPEAKRTKGPGVLSRASSFRNNSERPFSPSAASQDAKKASNLKRVSSIKNMEGVDKPAFARSPLGNGVDTPVFSRVPSIKNTDSLDTPWIPGRAASVDTQGLYRVPSRSGSCLPEREYSGTPPETPNSGRATPADALPGMGGWSRSGSVSREEKELPKGPARINTLWGVCIKEHAKMCIPDLEVLVNYPIDYRFPAFGKDKNGLAVGSGFFPADPISLHINPTPTSNNR